MSRKDIGAVPAFYPCPVIAVGEIARIAGAGFYEIVPEELYTSADLDWTSPKSRRLDEVL